MYIRIKSIESFLEVLKANDDSHPQVQIGGVGWPVPYLHFCETPGSSAAVADALAKNTSIKYLTLTQSLKLDAAGAKLIGDAIGNNTALKDLSLVDMRDMCDGYVEGMADGAGKSVSLTKLEAIDVKAQDVATIGRILGQSSSLVELVVKPPKFNWTPGERYSIEPDGITEIAGGITKSNTIQKLHISKCGITKSGADALWCALETSPCLRELDISKNDIGDSQVAKGVATLQKLNVNLCGIVGKKRVDAIGRALETSTSLVELDISSNPFGDVGARSLARGLTKNTTLKNLKAFGCNVKGPGSKAIGIALGSNSTLEELRWGTPMYEKDEHYILQEFGVNHREAVQWRNHIAKVGAEGFAEGLAKNRALKVLDLSDTRIESNGAQAIGRSLESNSHLCELNLQATSFSAKGMKCLGDSLGKNVALTSLNLNENWFGDMGAFALGRGMVGNRSLKSLQLINCQFKEAGAMSIGYALGTMPAMQKINMSGNYIGDAGALALASAIARNRSLENVRIGQSLSIEPGNSVWYCDHRYGLSDETLANFESAIRSSMPRAATLKIKETNNVLFKDLVALCEKKLQDQPMLVAFGMGMHKRLGERSIVQGLGSDIFKLVAKIGFESLELTVESRVPDS